MLVLTKILLHLTYMQAQKTNHFQVILDTYVWVNTIKLHVYTC